MALAPSAAFGTPPPAKRRSAAGYWLAGIVGFLTIVAAIALGVTRFVDVLDQPDGYARTDVPGTVSLRLDADPDKQIVYAEDTDRTLEELRVTVRSPSGTAIPVRRYSDGELSYDASAGPGRAVGQFEADESGTYRVTAAGSGAEGGSISVGTNLFGDIVGVFVGPALVVGIGGAIALTILIWTIIGRRRRPVDPGIGIT